jgi:hypothetical protein
MNQPKDPLEQAVLGLAVVATIWCLVLATYAIYQALV